MDKSNTPSDQTVKLTSLKVYPAILAAVGVAIALLAIGRYWGASEQAVSTDVDTSRLSPDIPAAPSDPTRDNSTAGDQIPGEQPTVPITDTDTSPAETSAAALSSNLRVSNRTVHPIRVALLPQVEAAKANPDGTAAAYDVPVHWDFAPGEGSQQGLLLSLPDQNIQLQAGDILVAFAQDGSRVYWGPYVVDQTNLPLWNESQQEWQLILEP
ncbi:MAG: hypothetical protein ACTS2F_19410 [Thainema sp.]